MNSLEEFIHKLNFKKAAIAYVIISGLLLLLCFSVIAYVSRDKIAMVIDYARISEHFAKEGVNDRLKTELQKLASDSKDINNVVVLDEDNTVIFKANQNLIGARTKLKLMPYAAGSGYLQDRNYPDHLFKVVKPENLILNKDYIPNDLHLSQIVDDELSYETDFSAKEVYLLNYLMNQNTRSKILLIRTATPIPFAERLFEFTGTLLGLMLAMYWIGLALWVYQDARRKKANASLWGLLALITNLAGLFVYLIYKQNNLICFKCGALQSKFSSFCSNCGTEINKSCPHCQAMISKRDIYCSRCGVKLGSNLGGNKK